MTTSPRMPDAYLALAKERAATAIERYKQPEGDDFGYDFRDWVSPYTKGAHRLGGVAVVLQDWASEEGLLGAPQKVIQELGRLPSLRTNVTLDELLRRVLQLSFDQIYATNAFPFVKPGNMSARLPMRDVFELADRFLRRELEIVRPTLVLALGAVPYAALRHIGIESIRLPHPAARIGDVNAHEARWRTALEGRLPKRSAPS